MDNFVNRHHTMIDLKTLWKDSLEIIKVSVSSANFSAWFAQTHLVTATEAGERVIVEIGCPTAFSKNTIESRYFGLVQDSLSKVLAKKCDLTFSVKENPDKLRASAEFDAPLFGKSESSQDLTATLLKARIRPHFTFENFAVSSSNQMAHAAAEAVAETPGTAYNPLFIWGGVGVGKSHLMHAVGRSMLAKDDSLNVLACTAEDFTNDIVEGIRNKSTGEVRKKYRKLNGLLIDDIQFIAGKDTAQEEFFHTFNTVTSAGGQVILTSDRPPSDIAKLEERLRSRFEAGLIVDVSPPDFELRCAIIQIKSKEKGIALSMEQVQMIAANAESARKIEGTLTKLITEVHIRKQEITNGLVEGVLSKKLESNGKNTRSSPGEAIDAVSRYYEVGKRQLLGESRARPVARPRQMLMYLLRTHLGIPLEEVGRIVGGRDHTTVMHAVSKITELATKDVQIRGDMLKIKNSL